MSRFGGEPDNLVPICHACLGPGFDAHRADPLGHLAWESATYGHLARRVAALSAELCQGRCLFTLEGGYHVPSLAESVQQLAQALVDGGEPAKEETPPGETSPEVQELIAAIRDAHPELFG